MIVFSPFVNMDIVNIMKSKLDSVLRSCLNLSDLEHRDTKIQRIILFEHLKNSVTPCIYVQEIISKQILKVSAMLL